MTENHVKAKLAEITLRDPAEIQMEMNLAEDLGIDSLAIASLISKFEEVIARHPSMNDYIRSLSQARTVQEFSDLILSQNKMNHLTSQSL